ncbi:MAG: AEC family transporter [Candidatus Thorarchaeota archaeon]
MVYLRLEMVVILQILGDLVIRLGFFYAFIALGFLVTRIGSIKAKLNKVVTFALINFMMPLLIIDTLLTANPTSILEVLGILLFTVFIHLFGFTLMYIRLRKTDIQKKEKGAYLLTVTFNNGIFLPLPIALMFIGEIAVPVIAIYSISQMIMLATLGTFMGSAYSENQDDRKAMLKKALTFPPLIAVVIALILLLSGVAIPSFIEPILDGNSFVTTYLALFAVGLSLGAQDIIKKSRYVYETIAIRQFVVPITVGLLLIFAGLTQLVSSVILLQAMMPAAVFTVIYSSALELDSESAATIVTLGTLVLLPIVPFMPLLFG